MGIDCTKLYFLRAPSGEHIKFRFGEEWVYEGIEDGIVLNGPEGEIKFKEQPNGVYVSVTDHKVVLAPLKRGHEVPRQRIREQINSRIGDILATRFERIGIIPIPGCPCKDLQSRLNGMTPEAVLSDLEGWSRKLQNGARKWKELKGGFWVIIPTPPLWICKRVLEDAIAQARGLLKEEDVTILEERG